MYMLRQVRSGNVSLNQVSSC